MRVLRIWIVIVIVVLGICAGILSSFECTQYAPPVSTNLRLKTAIVDQLHELKRKDAAFGWYCSSVMIPRTSSLDRIAPECEFARLYFHRHWWAQIVFPITVSRTQVDVALRKSDGSHQFVLKPFGDLQSFPAFLVWAGCRIQSEEDACAAVMAAYHSRDGGSSNPAHFVACRDNHNVWRIGSKPNGCEQPLLILETDEDGLVVRGTTDRL